MSGWVRVRRRSAGAWRFGLLYVVGHVLWLVAGPGLALAAAPGDGPPRSGGTAGAGETVLPRPLEPIRPEYPEGAAGDAAVRLEVVVGVDGAVQSMRVVDGDPPFSTSAMAAVARARFAPAKRGDRAIVARFLLDVRVEEPPPPAAEGAAPTADAAPANVSPDARGAGSANGAAAENAAPAASPPEASAALIAAPAPGAPIPPIAPGSRRRPMPIAPEVLPPIDVSVDGDRWAPPAPHAAGTHLSPAAAARLPGAFGDTFRAVEALPGVVPYASGLAYFFVRGAPPTSTGYFLDGIPVPLLFHVGAGPSVVAPSLISGVDFYPGAYPASFGRQVGGVLAGQLATPPARFSAEATLRFADAGAMVTAPLAGDRGVAFAAGRFSFTQALVPLITPGMSLGYWDYQVGVSYRPSAAEHVRLLAFGADDWLTQERRGNPRTLYHAQFHRVDLAYERGPGEPAGKRLAGALFGSDEVVEGPSDTRGRVRVAGTIGLDRSRLVGQGDIHGVLGQVRALGELPLHPTLRVRAGADALAESRDLDRSPMREWPSGDDGSFAETFADRAVGTYGAFADLVFRPRPFVELVAGVRADLFADPGGAATGVDPRATARVSLLPWLTSVTAFGVAHQRPSFVLPMPAVVPAADELVLQEALQMSQGVEVRLPARVTFQATGFLHELHNVTDYFATCWRRAEECRFFTPARGRSYGLELLLQRPLTERLGGQIAYTLSRSERTVGQETFAADTDRTHVVHVVLGWKPLPGLVASARITAYSGRPFTLSAGRRNIARGPGFFRLDARVAKTWRLGRTAHLSVAAEGLNITLSKEAIDVDCRSPVQLGQSCGPQELGPITIPSLGVSGGF